MASLPFLFLASRFGAKGRHIRLPLHAPRVGLSIASRSRLRLYIAIPLANKLPAKRKESLHY